MHSKFPLVACEPVILASHTLRCISPTGWLHSDYFLEFVVGGGVSAPDFFWFVGGHSISYLAPPPHRCIGAVGWIHPDYFVGFEMYAESLSVKRTGAEEERGGLGGSSGFR